MFYLLKDFNRESPHSHCSKPDIQWCTKRFEKPAISEIFYF